MHDFSANAVDLLMRLAYADDAALIIGVGITGLGSVMGRVHETPIRVRYNETDPMGFVHHSNYLNYFEIARLDLFTSAGGNYRQMEIDGLLVVVTKVECKYRKPAQYDDQLVVRTEIARITAAKIEHDYQVFRDHELLAEAHVVMAVVDRQGRVQRVPDVLLALTQ